MLLTNCRSKNKDKDFFYEGEYPPIESITITEDGESYNIQAISGQCIVFFKDDVSWAKANLVIERNGGKIIEQMPDFNYYLVSVKPGKENDFIERMRNEEPAEYVFLNTLCIENSEVYIIDDFTNIDKDLLMSHGNAVRKVFWKYSSIINVHNVDIKCTFIESLVGSLTASNNRTKLLFKSVSQIPNNQIGLVNISLGVNSYFGTKNGKKLLYDDLPDYKKKSYRKEYEELLESYAICLDKLRKRGHTNFLITNASGNEGMLEMEMIFDALNDGKKLSLEKNIVFVNAYDTRISVLYSNNTKAKHPLSTTIDLSSEPLPFAGTSFAAPKLLGFVDRISAKYKSLNAQDFLVAIRNASPLDPKQPMTYEMLEREAAKLAEAKKQCKQYTFTLNMTADYRGEWDLSEGERTDIVKYHVHDTYSYEYLSGEKMAIEIDNQTNYDLEMLLSVSDADEEIRPLRYILEKEQKGLFYVRQSDFFGDSEHPISVRELQVTITTW